MPFVYTVRSGLVKLVQHLPNGNYRIVRLLLQLDQSSGDDSFFLPTRKDMDAMPGITTESASKVTAELRRNGWLKPLDNNRACLDAEAISSQFD